ncbi:uncharacterized protein F5147DRAFT_776644 [Suillus discolor]|uniref:Uncharacterized protein n=1 Tax=Suillus discolor TaxID=1912936 RepID=A0A9P7F1N2_9AGAM|nr:uncharacterized protein F5147DRAFT_776644 [Suillus discolor]KAG2101295.1 hypothetical protein F5147DRAFT_776644 [Suillus discolor]
MSAFMTFTHEAQHNGQLSSDALKNACQNWATRLSRTLNPPDDTLSYIFQAFWIRHLLSWLKWQWCLKGLQSCLVVSSERQKFVKSLTSPFISAILETNIALFYYIYCLILILDPIHVQSNKALPAIIPDPKTSTIQASTPPSTSEMLKKGPSTPILTPPSQLIGTLRCSPSSPPFTPPLPHSPSPKLEIAVSHAGTSKKHMLDELGLDSDISFECVALAPTKHPKRDRLILQPEAGQSDKNARK